MSLEVEGYCLPKLACLEEESIAIERALNYKRLKT